jgi:hypothetical protein
VRKTANTDTSKELTDLEFERITGIAFPGLAIIFGAQSWFSEKNHQNWQIWYLLGLALGVSIYLILRQTTWSSVSYFPLIVFMLMAPVNLNSPTMSPWMSLGLLTFAISAYLSAIGDIRIVIPELIILTITQIWLIRKNLPAFTDNRDMSLLHTYFSTTYTFGIGIAIYLIRLRYVEGTRAADEKIESALSNIMVEMKRLARINRQDQRNLKLHGTTLNTLLFFKNKGNLLKSRFELANLLDHELSELSSLTSQSHRSLREDLELYLQNRTQNRVQIKNLKIRGAFKGRRTHETVLELVREVLLNLEKHTNATSTAIYIDISDDDSFEIRISEDSTSRDTDDSISKALGSQSLNRILSLVNASLSLTPNRNRSGLTYQFSGSSDVSRANPEKIVLNLRNAALNKFAIDIIKVGIIFALIDLCGYVFLDLRPLVFIMISLADALIFAYAFRFNTNRPLFFISNILTLLLLPLAALNVTNFSQVAFFPTLFNLILSSTFLVALESKSRVLRWVPLFLFTLEAIFIPYFLPNDSRDIFAGSTPAIPLITLFAIAVIRLRQKVAAQDTEQIRRVFDNQENVRRMEQWVDEEYRELVESLKDFSVTLKSGKFSEAQLQKSLSIQIQSIRSLLICSEHVESELVRNLYRRLKFRYQRGLDTRISLNGQNFFQFDDQFDFKREFDEIAKYVNDLPFELNLLLTDELTIELKIKKMNPPRKSKLNKTIKKFDSKVNYLISVG